MAGSMLYLYLAMIPDLAFVSDRLGDGFGTIKRGYYRLLSIAWADSDEQRATLHRAIVVMTIAMVPVAVMMHTVTSWIFGMTLREPWNSAMFGIFFVAGAIYSGIGLIVILMAVMRRAYRLEEFITDRHFLYLGYMLAAFAVIMVFFNVSEFVTLGYKLSADATFNLNQMVSGDLAPVFWTYVWAGLALPILVILIPYTRNLKGILVAAIAANVGMFLERYFIVVGGLRVPLNPYEPATYTPSWVEWSLMAGGVAIFLLLVTVLLKLLPVVALWEMHEEAFASGPATSPGGYADPSETFAGVADPGIVAGARS
jgi:molybdopterin-containing oxidoreductase family membrane subunit